MIVMHSTFNLLDGQQADEFKSVFDAFAAHLHEKRLVTGWRYMQRAPHDGYNADMPEGQHYLMTEFIDMEQAQACWDYVEEDSEPIASLHRDVRTRITNSSFYLCRDV